MTHDEREKLSPTQESLFSLHLQLQESNRDKRTARMRLAWALAGIMACLLVMGLYWPVQRECATLAAVGQERVGDLVAMKAQAEWYASQKLRLEEDLGKWQARSLQDLAARKVAERELAVRMAQQVVIPEPKPLDRLEVATLPLKAMVGRWAKVAP